MGEEEAEEVLGLEFVFCCHLTLGILSFDAAPPVRIAADAGGEGADITDGR